jgi:hypothetical protein
MCNLNFFARPSKCEDSMSGTAFRSSSHLGGFVHGADDESDSQSSLSSELNIDKLLMASRQYMRALFNK